MSIQALERAVSIAGGQSALAKKINSLVPDKIQVKQQNIWAWLNKSGTVPAEYAIPIELATGGQVKRHEIRPDIYPEAAATCRARLR